MKPLKIHLSYLGGTHCVAWWKSVPRTSDFTKVTCKRCLKGVPWSAQTAEQRAL